MLITLKIGGDTVPVVPPADAVAYAVVENKDGTNAGVIFRFKGKAEANALVSLIAVRAAMKDLVWHSIPLDPGSYRHGGVDGVKYGTCELRSTPNGWLVSDAKSGGMFASGGVEVRAKANAELLKDASAVALTIKSIATGTKRGGPAA